MTLPTPVGATFNQVDLGMLAKLEATLSGGNYKTSLITFSGNPVDVFLEYPDINSMLDRKFPAIAIEANSFSIDRKRMESYVWNRKVNTSGNLYNILPDPEPYTATYTIHAFSRSQKVHRQLDAALSSIFLSNDVITANNIEWECRRYNETIQNEYIKDQTVYHTMFFVDVDFVFLPTNARFTDIPEVEELQVQYGIVGNDDFETVTITEDGVTI